MFLPLCAEAQNWGRGPIQATDLFPISLGRLNYYPSSPKTTEFKTVNLRTALHWANTINGKHEQYLIDAESREQLFSARYGLTQNTEFGLHLPLLWRGSGFLDSYIYDWHKFWGLPQGPRQETEQDRYEIAGIKEDREVFRLEERGLKFGDLKLSAKKLFTKGDHTMPAVAAEFLLSAPTGSYSTNGVEFLSSLNLSKKIGVAYLYAGSFVSFLQKINYQDIEYERFRYGGSLFFEFPLDLNYSILCGFSAGSNITSDILTLPNYQLYGDLGLKYGISASSELELLIRENPAPEEGSSDFSILVAINSRFNT